MDLNMNRNEAAGRRYQERYETLVMNAQKGISYFVKLKNDPTIYRAIPMIDRGFDTSGDHQFLMKVLLPEKDKGVYLHMVDDIEMLDTDPWSYGV